MGIRDEERITAEECWERYGWGTEAKPGSMVRHFRCGKHFEVFVDEMRDESYGGRFGCEVYGLSGLIGQWFDDAWEDAVYGAVVEAVAICKEVFETEGNCEDAVNVIAYHAYQALFGPCHIMEMDRRVVDVLMGHAIRYVKANCGQHGVEWEEETWDEDR